MAVGKAFRQALSEKWSCRTERIRRTIRAFLNLVRDESPILGNTSPAAVLDGAIALVDHRFAAAQVALTRTLAPDLRPIRCDVPMLAQAIVNLLLNACDACPPGGHVDVQATAEGEQVAFAVVDDGIGIDKEAAEQATKPFFTTKPRGQGTGLGLAIANEIVKLHRGILQLEPATPRGTRAVILVPVAQANADAK